MQAGINDEREYTQDNNHGEETKRGASPSLDSTGWLGCDLIAAERLRQIKKEKWSANHDDEHRRMEMTRAAASYALHVWVQSNLIETYLEGYVLKAALQTLWPWEHEWWKPADDPVRTLVKAGALIAAEIDRLERLRIGDGAKHPNDQALRPVEENS